MCVLSIKVPIRKKSGNLFNDHRICIINLNRDITLKDFGSDGLSYRMHQVQSGKTPSPWWPRLLGLQNTPIVSLQKGKTTPTNVLVAQLVGTAEYIDCKGVKFPYECPVGSDCRIHRLHLCKGVRPLLWMSLWYSWLKLHNIPTASLQMGKTPPTSVLVAQSTETAEYTDCFSANR